MDEQKKILLVANVAKEHINKFHIPTIKEFKKHGWIVDVACSGDVEVPECDHQFNMCWKRSPFTYKTIRGIFHLKRLLRENKYDVIYCHTPVGGLVARIAASHARRDGTRVIYCAHGFHFFKGAPIINWILFYPMEKILAHFCDAVFTVNQDDYNFAKDRFTKNTEIVLVPEVGVNFERLNISDSTDIRTKYRNMLGIKDDEVALIYVAELLANKNQIMLVNVLNKLLNKGEKIKLILPGPDHANGELKGYIEQNNLSENVKLLGWRSDVGELLRACDICTASSIREGFGINLVEAMYCGLPVIATDNRGHRMIIEDGKNGFLVKINDVDGMTERVLQLIHNYDLYKSMSGLDVSHYDCNLVAKQLFVEIWKRVQ